MLIHAVDQRAVEVEEENGFDAHGAGLRWPGNVTRDV
jgi:hypothetical protein